MVITLYKDCIINKSYSEVFDVVPRTIGTTPNTSVFEQYLGTLSKRIIVTSNNYYKENSYIQLDVVQGNDYITDFNYMKIVVDNLIRYCFIDHVELCNAVAKVYYTEDVWHTYAKTMHIRNSLLVNSKTRKYGNNEIDLYKLPMEYMTNVPINPSPLFDWSTFNVIVQFQYYLLSSGAEEKVDNRETFTAILGDHTVTGREKYNLSMAKVIEILTNTEKYKPIAYYKSMCKYEITNVTVIPSSFNILNNQFISITDERRLYYNDESGQPTICAIGKIKTPSNFIQVTLLDNQTISNNFYNCSLGTFTNQYTIDNNGKDITWSLSTKITEYDFKLFLSFQGKIFDIVNDFVVKVPFESLDASAFAQRQIATEQKITNAKFDIARGGVRLGEGLLDTSYALAGLPNLSQTKKNARKIERQMQWAQTGANQIIDSGIDIVQGIFDINYLKKDKFSTSSGCYTSDEGLINAMYGICKFVITPSNTTQVNNMIDNIGYEVYEIVDDIFNDVDDISEIEFDCVKFDFVNCYGKFNQGIETILKEILTKGFKIWYTVNV